MTHLFTRGSIQDGIQLFYYPGVVSVVIFDEWNPRGREFSINLTDWRAMNNAVERAHGGIEDDQKCS